MIRALRVGRDLLADDEALDDERMLLVLVMVSRGGGGGGQMPPIQLAGPLVAYCSPLLADNRRWRSLVRRALANNSRAATSLLLLASCDSLV